MVQKRVHQLLSTLSFQENQEKFSRESPVCEVEQLKIQNENIEMRQP
jgi:hypothetical protein